MLINMNAEEFIKNNPFPKNGTAINNMLVKDIQDVSKASEKQRNCELLFKNNARLIHLVYKQYNYNQPIDSIMSFVYEGLIKATETYDPSVGMPFYNYAIRSIRGILQNWYNYNNDLIHIPVMKKKEVKHEYADITDFIEHQEGESKKELELPIESEYSDELNEIITSYMRTNQLSDDVKYDFQIFAMYRKYTVKEIIERTDLTENNLKCIVAKTLNKLKKYCRQGN